MAAAYAFSSRLTSSNVAVSFLVSPYPRILGEDQKVAAFFQGSFGYVHESRFVRFAASAESLDDVGRNGYCRSAHLLRQGVSFLLGKVPVRT
jgi:hypothetical protein